MTPLAERPYYLPPDCFLRVAISHLQLIPVHRVESCRPSYENLLLPGNTGIGARVIVNLIPLIVDGPRC